MRARIILTLLGLVVAVVTVPVVAKEYAIEIIVFDKPVVVEMDDGDEYRDDDGDEFGNGETDLIIPDALITGGDYDGNDDGEDEQPEPDFSEQRNADRLAQMEILAAKVGEHPAEETVSQLEEVQMLLTEAGYRILSAARWQQPTSTYREAPVIALGDPTTDLPAGFVRVYTTTLIYADIHLQLSPLPVTVWDAELNGALEAGLTLSELPDALVIETPAGDDDRKPAPAKAGGDDDRDDDGGDDRQINLEDLPEPTGHFFIAEKRRVQFNQVHYFDHPMFGAILGVWEAEEVPCGEDGDEDGDENGDGDVDGDVDGDENVDGNENSDGNENGETDCENVDTDVDVKNN